MGKCLRLLCLIAVIVLGIGAWKAAAIPAGFYVQHDGSVYVPAPHLGYLLRSMAVLGASLAVVGLARSRAGSLASPFLAVTGLIFLLTARHGLAVLIDDDFLGGLPLETRAANGFASRGPVWWNQDLPVLWVCTAPESQVAIVTGGPLYHNPPYFGFLQGEIVKVSLRDRSILDVETGPNGLDRYRSEEMVALAKMIGVRGGSFARQEVLGSPLAGILDAIEQRGSWTTAPGSSTSAGVPRSSR